MAKVTGSEEELDRLRQVLVEAIDEEKNKTQRQRENILILMDINTFVYMSN